MRRLERVALAGLLLAACSAPVPAAEPPTSSPPSTAPPTTSATAAPASPTRRVAPTASTSAPASPTSLVPPPAAAPAATTAPSASGSLVRAVEGSLSKTLHPYPDRAAYTPAWLDAAGLIWGGADGSGALLAYDWDALTYRPAMASGLPRVSSDGKTLTFTLRDDLRWSDGSPIGVADFQLAFDQASRDENQYVQLALLQEIATFRTPDQRTLEVTLREARARDVALAIANLVTPVPRHVWAGRSWNDTAANPEILNPSVVLGPFRVEDYRAAERASFVAIATYPAGVPRVPRVEILANQAPFDALSSGRVNWIHALAPAQYQEAKANVALQVKDWTPANAAYRSIEFNVTRPFLSDKRVRQALARSISRADLIAQAERGLAVPQYGFEQPTNTRWVNPNVDHYELDLAAARSLLEQAGYALRASSLVGSDGQPVKVQVVYPTSSTARATIAQYAKTQFAKLGIATEVQPLDFNAYTDAVEVRRDFDVALASYAGGAIDPDLGPRAQLVTNGQQNATGYSNPQVDDLFRQAGTSLDDARRKELYDQLQTLVNADLPAHYLYALTSVDVFGRGVHGMTSRRGERLDSNDALLAWSVEP